MTRKVRRLFFGRIFKCVDNGEWVSASGRYGAYKDQDSGMWEVFESIDGEERPLCGHLMATGTTLKEAVGTAFKRQFKVE